MEEKMEEKAKTYEELSAQLTNAIAMGYITPEFLRKTPEFQRKVEELPQITRCLGPFGPNHKPFWIIRWVDGRRQFIPSEWCSGLILTDRPDNQ